MRTTKSTPRLLALLVTIGLFVSAIANAAVDTIGVSFTGRGDCADTGCSTLAPATVAGLIPQANWNNINNHDVFNGTSGALNDSNAVPTAVTLTYDANDSWNNDDTTVVTGDEQMFKGISKANGTDHANTYTFNNVPTGTYDLIVYLNVNGDGRIGDISCNGATFYFTSQHSFGGTFIQAVNTSPTGPRDTGNYVRFPSVKPNGSGQIAVSFINRGDPDGIGIAGFQLVQSAAPVTNQVAVNFQGRGDCADTGCSTLAPATVAGVVPQANWNNINDHDVFGGVSGALNDSNAVPTAITLTYDANDSWNNDDGTVVTGDEQMFKGISKAAGVNRQNRYVLNNVSPGVVYDLYVYLNVNGDGRIGDISCQGTTFYFTSEHTFNGTFTQVKNTNPGGPRDTGNYARFLSVRANAAGQIPVSFINRGDPDGIGVAGLQLIPAAAPVPTQLAVSFTGRVGDNVPGPSLASGDVAGFIPQGNWNNINNSSTFNGTSGALNDSNAAPTIVTLTYDANDAWNNDGAEGTPDEKMFKGISKANGTDHVNTYTFNNVRPGLYDVIVYLNVNGDGRIGDIACGGTTYYFTSQHSFGGTFIQTASTVSGTRPVGNFVRFYGVPASGAGQIPLSFINRGDPDGIGIAGFQLLPVPPSATVAVNFQGRGDCADTGCSTLAPATVAGLIPQANWNNINNHDVFNGITGPLNDANAAVTQVTLNYDANDAWNNDDPSVVTGDEQMFKGISKSFGADHQNNYTFSGIRPGVYDLIVYLNVNGDGRIGDIACNGVTHYFTSQHTFGGTFIESLNTSPGGTRDVGNYVRFRGITVPPGPGNLPVTFINRGDPDGIGIAGFQIVQVFGPALVSASTVGNPNVVFATFSAAMNATALNPANYALDNGVTVSGVTFTSPASNTVRLVTSTMTVDTVYTLTVSNAQDQSGLAVSPNPSTTVFRYGSEFPRASLRIRRYDGSGDFPTVLTKIATCVTPQRSGAMPDFEYTTSEAGDVANGNLFGDPNTENYGMIVVGQFAPPTTGNYQFGFSSDDHGELFLSTDEKPANKVLISQIPAWNGYRRYVTQADPGSSVPMPSGLIPLVAGKTYYMEAVVAEGGGGDHVAVAVRHPGDPALVDFQATISSALFASNYIYNGTCPPTTFGTIGPVFITENLYSTNVIENSPVTFRIGFDGTPPYTVQWFSNSTPVVGSTAGTNSTFTTFVKASDAGTTFRAVVNNDFSAVTSVVSTITVTLAPQFTNASSFNDPANHIYVQYSKPMGASALDTTKYGVSGGVTVSAAAFHNAAQTMVRLDVSPLTPFTSYTVTVSGVLDSAGNLLNPNPTARNFTHFSGINAPQGLSMKRFDGSGDFTVIRNKIATCAVAQRSSTDMPDFEYTTSDAADVAGGNLFLDANTENYGTWVYGLYVAPATGNYRFIIASDDHGELFLSTDSSPANKVMISQTPAWNGYRAFVTQNDVNSTLPIPSGLIPLVAGQRYYMEAIVQEGGGGDHVAVAVQLPGGPAIVNGSANVISRNSFATNYSIGCPPSFYFNAGPIVITTQPTNQTVTELAVTTFRVAFDGSPDYFIQWYSNNVAIPNATNQAFTYQPLRYASNSQYYVTVANGFSSATSSVVTLSVLSDEVSPTLLSAIGAPSRTTVSLIFSEPLAVSGATNPSNYSISNAAGANLALNASVPPKLSPDGKSVTLTTVAQTSNVQYFVVVGNVTDRAGIPNVISPNPSVASFVASELNALPGFVVFRAYPTGGGNTIGLLTGHPSFPNSPDFIAAIPGMNSRLAPAPYNNNSREAYGGTIVGHFVPPTSGNWIFYTSADDDGQLVMNTNGPSSAGAVEVRFAPGCCRALASGADPTAPFSLLAGQAYYIEARFKEGTGGDYIEVGARLQGDTSTIVPIGSANLAFYYLLKILQSPTNVTKQVGQIATFNVVATVDGAGAGSQEYQWQRSTDTTGTTFTNIPGGTNASFSLPVSAADDQFQFRAEVRLSVLQTNLSSAAILTVVPDTDGPTLVSVRTDGGFQTIYLRYSEAVDPGTAGEASNYILYDPASTFKPQVGSVEYFGSNVVLHLVDPDNSQPMSMLPNTVYTLELDVQQDLVGNASVPSPIFADFQTWVFSCGFVRFDAYLNLIVPDANNVGPLEAAIAAGPSTFHFYTNQVNWPQTVPGNGIENYGMRFTGLFLAPETGTYKFEPSHDDGVRIRFSADSSPTNIVATFDEVCCNGFGAAEAGLTIALTAGNLYWFEVLVIEAGGGDYAGLSVTLPSGPYIAPIPAQYLVSIVDPAEASSNNAGFDVQPQSQIIVAGTQATFTGSVTNPGPSGLFYQWQLNGIDIPGANSTSYTTPFQTVANDGDLYRLMACMPGRTIFSSVATLTVLPDNISPTLVSARAIGPDLIELLFSEPIDAGTAAEASNFEVVSASGAIGVSTSTIGSDPRKIILDLSANMPCEYITVIVNGVADIVGNVIAPDSQASFMNYPPGLTHRYSFNNPAAGDAGGATVLDSIGTAHGTVRGAGTTLTGSRVTIPGGPSATAGYVDFPNGLLSVNSANNGGSGQVTFEGWVKVTGLQQWSRILDIGNSSVLPNGENPGPGGGGDGRDYIFYAAAENLDPNRHVVTVREVDPLPDGTTLNSEVGVGQPTVGFNNDMHWAITWDEATGAIRIYENGIQVNNFTTPVPFNEIHDVNVWLGRSQWSGDANMQGEFDEFRIYNKVLTPTEIALNGILGPNMDFGQLLAVRLLVPTNTMFANAFQQATILADFTSVSNFNLTFSGCAQLISSSPAVVALSGTNGLQGLSAGTSDIVATFAGLTSSIVTITVVADDVAPVALRARPINQTQIEIQFSEAIDAGTASESSNFQVSSPGGPLSIVDTAIAANPTRVVITLSAPLPCELITITIDGILDLAGNPIAPGSTVSFVNLSSGLEHRYTFNNTAGTADGATLPDVVGGANGAVRGNGAGFTGTRLTLPGGSSATAPYADLPNGLWSKHGLANGGSGQGTIEGWVKNTGNQAWSRIFDFGSTSGAEITGPGGGGNGWRYITLSAQVNTDVNAHRFELAGEGAGAFPNGFTQDFPAQFNQDTHFVVTWNELTDTIEVYRNGVLAVQRTTPALISDVQDVNVWLGRSTWTGDANLQGEFDDFRIYDRALTAGEVAFNGALGPDIVAGAPLAVHLVVPDTSVDENSFQQATVLADYPGHSNVNITALGCYTILSTAPSVVAGTPTGGLQAGDPGTADVRVTFAGQTSSVVTITVSIDLTKPTVVRVRGVRTLDAIEVLFSETVDEGSAEDSSNYALTDTNGAPVSIGSPVLGPDGRTVTIPVNHAPGTVYNLAISGISDIAGVPNVMNPTNIMFQTWTIGLGSLIFDSYLGLSLNPVIEDLTNAPAFPNNPSEYGHVAGADSRRFYPNDSHEGYGARMSGYFVPQLSTNHTFYLRSDDASKLFLSTDSQESNKVQLAFEPNCCNPYSAHASSPVPLIAGQRYYFEVIYKEGTGGDYAQVAVKTPSNPMNPDSLPPIYGGLLASLADPIGASVTITQQPVSVTVTQGFTATLSVGSTGTNDYGDYNQVAYQWQQRSGVNWINLPGANGSTYSTLVPVGPATDYRALVYIPGASATSAVATLFRPMTIVWTEPGILQEADEVTGPWTDLPLATSPYYVDPGLAPKKFFRLRPLP